MEDIQKQSDTEWIEVSYMAVPILTEEVAVVEE
jgi:hypothetical protein